MFKAIESRLNHNSNIWAFCGRKGSGKTTVANWLIENKRFRKISFADELRSIVSKIYDIPVNALSDPATKEVVLSNPLEWNEITADKVAALIKATKPLNSENVIFPSYRRALEYIGTNVLRQYDQLFHIKSVEKYLDGKVVLDDVRFGNEADFLNEHKANFTYMVRPYNFNYSEAPSEIDVTRDRFPDRTILNDEDVYTLNKKFRKLFWWRKGDRIGSDLFIKVKCVGSFIAGIIAIGRLVRDGHRWGHIVTVANSKMINKIAESIESPMNYIRPKGYSGLFHEISIFDPYHVDDLKYYGLPLYSEGKYQIPKFVMKNFDMVKCYLAGLACGLMGYMSLSSNFNLTVDHSFVETLDNNKLKFQIASYAKQGINNESSLNICLRDFVDFVEREIHEFCN